MKNHLWMSVAPIAALALGACSPKVEEKADAHYRRGRGAKATGHELPLEQRCCLHLLSDHQLRFGHG